VKVYSTEVLDDASRILLEPFGLREGEADGETLASAEVLISFPYKVTPSLLASMRSLRAVQTISAGVDNIAYSALPPGAVVFSNAGAFTEQVAEHAWGLAFGAAKGLGARDQRVPPYILRGKTLLVLGCGAIGSSIAEKGKRWLSMRTVGISRSFRTPEVFDEKHPISTLGSVIESADLIMDALPLTRETRGILNYDLLQGAKRSVVIVNVGRGDTVDLDSITRLLSERPETRFGTDVYWRGADGRENFNVPLWGLPNFVGTIHAAGGTLSDPTALKDAKTKAAENVRLFLTTGSAKNRVNVEEYRA